MTYYMIVIAASMAFHFTPSLLIAAQERATSVPAAPTQVYCPVLTDQKIDPEIFTDYHNQRIYLCCDRCRVKFIREPERYIAQLHLNESTPSQSATTQRAEHDQNHTDGGSEPTVATKTDAPDHNAANHHHDDEELAGASSPEHEHAHDEHGTGDGPRWVSWIGGFHPPMTNFPIGVLVAAALAEALFIKTRRTEFDHAARLGIVFAVVTGIAAGLLGWGFGGFQIRDADTLLTIHRWLGTSTVALLIALLWASEHAHRRPDASRSAYRLLLFGGTALVLTTGFFGGAMIYGLDHYLP